MSKADFELAGFQETEYAGDSVYVGHDGYHMLICTNNGYGVENKIALEPAVFKALIKYQERLIARNKESK